MSRQQIPITTLVPGTNGDVAQTTSGAAAWGADPGGGGGFTNPMTTQDDLIVGGAAGAAARLAKGTDGQVLTVDPTTHHLVWATPSAGGSASTIYTNAYASPPASPANGDSWYPSDGVGLVFLRVSGAWVARWRGYPVTDPTTPSFAWINQGSAAVSTVGGAVSLSVPAVSGDNLRIRKIAAPSTPYTITAALTPQSIVTGAGFGLCFRQSSDGKLATWFWTGSQLLSQKWTNPTTFSANYASQSTNDLTGRPARFLRIADNGTSRIVSFSPDGQQWTTYHTVGRTDFLTADEVGWFGNSADASNALIVTLLSWVAA